MAEQNLKYALYGPRIRRFVLWRKEDLTGVSGTGIVAQGVQFDDGRVSLRWLSEKASTANFDSIDDVTAIHGHDGATVVDWIDAGHGCQRCSGDLTENINKDGDYVRCLQCGAWTYSGIPACDSAAKDR